MEKKDTTKKTKKQSKSFKIKPFLKRFKYVLLSIVIVLSISIVTIGYIFVKQGEKALLNLSDYHAVFLDNGQVYFGKLKKSFGSYFVLTDVYYLQFNNQNPGQPEANTPEMALIKLGDEFHKPTNRMSIERSHILFWEEIQQDSKIIEAIQEQENLEL